MKVLHVIPTFAPAWRYGGPIVAALGMTRELVRQGHEVTVMTTNVDGPRVLDVPLQRPVDMDGVEVQYFPVQRPRWYYFSRPLGQALGRRVPDFDIVHTHSIFLWPTTIAAYWSRRHRVPYLIRPAGSLDPILFSKSYAGWWTSTGSRLKKALYLNTFGRLDLNRASAMHYTSQAEMEASGWLRLRPPRYVLPLGVDLPPPVSPDERSAWGDRYPALKGKKIVLFMSRLDPKKGLDILVAALGGLAARRADFALAVAGTGSSAYESLMTSLVRKNGLAERAAFVGMVEGADKWALLREAAVFVLPSHHENFGMAVVEAMAAGVPVVISDRVNIHREVGSAGAGIVTGLETAEIAAALDRLLAQDGLRTQMGAAGARLARGQFSWERAVRRIVKAYEDILGGAALARASAAPYRRD